MTDSDKQKKWIEAMRRRAELMNDVYARIEELSLERDRQGILDYLGKTLDATPIESGNVVTCGSLEVEFDDDNRVVDIRSDDGTSSFSVKQEQATDDD